MAQTNPYCSPVDAASAEVPPRITYSPGATIGVFATSGFIAGLCSGATVILRPLGVVSPGVFFGLALTYAITRSIQPLRIATRISLVACSTLAHLLAICAALLSMRLPGIGNGILSSAISGGLAGWVGATAVGFSIFVLVPRLRSMLMLGIVMLAGAIFGTLFGAVGVYISDHTTLGHPFDDLVIYPLWHTGVAASIALIAAAYMREHKK